MDAPKNFRSAFNGFNREDVVHYIEYMNTKHTTQINELNTQVEFLRGKLNAAQAAPSVDSGLVDRLNEALNKVTALEERCAALEKERDDALASAADASALRELEARCAALTAERDTAQAAAALAEAERDKAAQTQNARELEAYRRAERMERVAMERAGQVYNRVNAVLADATVKVDEASAQISQMEQIMAQLGQLQDSISAGKQALEAASATMYAIRPSAEEE